MEIEKIDIENYKSIRNVSFEFDSSLNVFAGINGAGKTTILETLTISLSWLMNRIQRENSNGKHISENDIRIGTAFSSLTLSVLTEKKESYTWELIKAQRGESDVKTSNLTQVSALARNFRDNLHTDNKLPVIAYYPVNRIVKDVSPDLSSKEDFQLLDVYENALGVRANFQSFFDWFKIQDDILNERLSSRTKWISNNNTWIKEKIDQIIQYLPKTKDTKDLLSYFKKNGKHSIFIEHPEYLFIELNRIFFRSKTLSSNKQNHFLEKSLFDLDYFFHKMQSLSRDKKGDLIDSSSVLISFITKILQNIAHSLNEVEDPSLISFLWESLQFAILLSLWWISDKGKNAIETLFKEYNPTLKRDKKLIQAFTRELEHIIQNEANRQDTATRTKGREISIVTKTIEKFITGYSNLRIKRTPRPHMLVDKNGTTFNLEQLSDGEKNLIALVGDITRRLSIANPNSKEPLKGDGIILIDEIDLHLHPSWQRLIIPKLLELFPNCQFFISTHSPQVLSHVQPSNTFLLDNTNNELSYSQPSESYGQSTNRILEDLLDVDARPTYIKDRLHNIFKLIQDKKLKDAKKEINQLEKEIGEDSELMKATVLIKRMEIIGK